MAFSKVFVENTVKTSLFCSFLFCVLTNRSHCPHHPLCPDLSVSMRWDFFLILRDSELFSSSRVYCVCDWIIMLPQTGKEFLIRMRFYCRPLFQGRYLLLTNTLSGGGMLALADVLEQTREVRTEPGTVRKWSRTGEI